MKQLLFVFLMVFCSLADAQVNTVQDAKHIDVSKMTPEQKARMLQLAAELEQKEKSGMSERTREEISKWGELGVGMGKAAVAAAKEVGMAANEFVGTPLGKVTMAVVIYKVVGKDALRLMIASTVFIVFMSLAIFFLVRPKGEVKYRYEPRMWGLWQKRLLESYTPDSDIVLGHYIGALLCGAVAIIACLNAI